MSSAETTRNNSLQHAAIARISFGSMTRPLHSVSSPSCAARSARDSVEFPECQPGGYQAPPQRLIDRGGCADARAIAGLLLI